MGRTPALAIVVILLALAAAACTRRTEGYCCTSADLCNDVGGVLQLCPSGQICDDLGAEGPKHTCITDPAAQDCTGPEDCAPPTPACFDEVCVECDQDEHCTTPTAPVCDLDLHRCGDCGENSDCERFGGVCGPNGNCVQCTPAAMPVESEECDAPTTVCDTDGSCRGCRDHRECDSGACDLDSQTCVEETSVAYVDATAPAGNMACTRSSPCRTINLGLAADAGTRAYVVIAAGTYAEDVNIDNRTVTLIGYGATQHAASIQVPSIDVFGASGTVSVYGMKFELSDIGVQCNGENNAATVALALVDVTIDDVDGVGVLAQRCNLTMSRVRVTRAAGGGVDLSASGFDITNSVLAENGALGEIGGMRISQPRAAPNRLAFTTIANNQVAIGSNAPGLHCTGISPIPPFHSNIITDNDGSAAAQVSGQPNCIYEQSLINPPVEGEGNIQGDALLDGTYHIGETSPAREAARPGSGVLDDIDGEPRPVGLPDIGADEFTP